MIDAASDVVISKRGGKTMEGASRNEIVRTVQTDIEHGVSVYDEQFAQQREWFGDAFVHEYLSEVATHMAVHIVRAFEEHDRKRYQRCARSVYVFLFPISVRAAQTAGASYALALKHHDGIEDGVHAVTSHEPIIGEYFEGDTEVPPTVQAILDHPYWNAVLLCFELVAETLELPDAYAEEQTEFFGITRRHRKPVINHEQNSTSRIDGDGSRAMRAAD